jgi:hypothetical protein
MEIVAMRGLLSTTGLEPLSTLQSGQYFLVSRSALEVVIVAGSETDHVLLWREAP